MGTAIVITSGKGGTGKTALTCGIGAGLARLGKRVLCLDMDVGLRNLDLTMGMTDRALMDFTDVLFGRCPLERAVVPHPSVENLFLLTAPVTWGPVPVSQSSLKRLMNEIRSRFDYCLIDCPAGIGPGFHLAVCAADRAIVVVTTDSAALRDAQQVVSQLHRYRIPVHLVVNRISRWMIRRLGMNVDDAMDAAGLPLLGIVPEERKVALYAARGQLPQLPESLHAARAWRSIARRLEGRRVPVGWR